MFVWFLVNSGPKFSYWFRTGLVLYSHLKICIYLRYYCLWSISFKYWNWWSPFQNSLFYYWYRKTLKIQIPQIQNVRKFKLFLILLMPPCPPLDPLLGTARSLLFFVCALKIEFHPHPLEGCSAQPYLCYSHSTCL